MSEDKYKSIKTVINALGTYYNQILQPEKMDIHELREKAAKIEEMSQILLSDVDDLEEQLFESGDGE